MSTGAALWRIFKWSVAILFVIFLVAVWAQL